MHKKLPHLIYFALVTNYFNVFMSTTVLLGLTSFEKIGGQWIFGGASDFSNLLAPWASGSRSLMLRAVEALASITQVYQSIFQISQVEKAVHSAKRKTVYTCACRRKVLGCHGCSH